MSQIDDLADAQCRYGWIVGHEKVLNEIIARVRNGDKLIKFKLEMGFNRDHDSIDLPDDNQLTVLVFVASELSKEKLNIIALMRKHNIDVDKLET